MKITFVLPSLAVGGGVRVVLEYANRLIERGHEVSIVYPVIPPFPNDLFRQFGLRNSILKFLKSRSSQTENNWKVNAKLIRVPTLSPKLKGTFERKIPDADAIVATEWRTAYAVAKLGSEKGEKFHFIQHYECWEAWDDERCWERMKNLEKDPNRLSLAMADVDTSDLKFHKTKILIDNSFRLPLRKITISSWLKELIEIKFNQKVEGIIINGVDFARFYNENKGSNNQKEKKNILAPYRDMKWKGMEDAIKAFEIVKEKYPNAHFLMFGPVKPKVPDWIEFHRISSDEQLRKLYSAADIFVFPSWVEGFGLPPMEAMACRCAVVSTDVGAISEYAIPGKTICAVPPRQPEALAEETIELLRNQEKLQKLSEAGYEHIKHFTWKRSTDEFENIICGGKYEKHSLNNP